MNGTAILSQPMFAQVMLKRHTRRPLVALSARALAAPPLTRRADALRALPAPPLALHRREMGSGTDAGGTLLKVCAQLISPAVKLNRALITDSWRAACPDDTSKTLIAVGTLLFEHIFELAPNAYELWDFHPDKETRIATLLYKTHVSGVVRVVNDAVMTLDRSRWTHLQAAISRPAVALTRSN